MLQVGIKQKERASEVWRLFRCKSRGATFSGYYPCDVVGSCFSTAASMSKKNFRFSAGGECQAGSHLVARNLCIFGGGGGGRETMGGFLGPHTTHIM